MASKRNFIFLAFFVLISDFKISSSDSLSLFLEDFISRHSIKSFIIVNNQNEKINSSKINAKHFCKTIFFQAINQTQLYADFVYTKKSDLLKPLIFLEEYDSRELNTFLRKLYKVNDFYLLKKSIWMTDRTVSKYDKIVGPFNARMLHIKKSEIGFDVFRLYLVKGKSFIKKYAIWNYDERSMEMGTRENHDFNQTNLLALSPRLTYELCDSAEYFKDKLCGYMILLKDIVQTVNLRITEIPGEEWKSYGRQIDIINEIVRMNSNEALGRQGLRTFICSFPNQIIDWIIKEPKSRVDSFYYLRPFECRLWYCILFIIIIGGMSFSFIRFIYSWIKKVKNGSFADFFFMAIEPLLNQGFLDCNFLAVRLANFFFCFFSLFILTSYSSDLAAYLAVRKTDYPFSDLHAFAKIGTHIILVSNTSFLPSMFLQSKDSAIRLIEKKKLLRIFNTMKEGWSLLCETDNGVLPLPRIYNPFMATECKIRPLPKYLVEVPSTIRLGSWHCPSPFDEVFNKYFYRSMERGLVHRIESINQMYWVHDEEESTDLTIEHVYTLFSFFLYGMILSFILVVVEISFFKVVKRRK